MKQISSKIFETILLQNLWNCFPPKSLKQISSKIFETIFFQNLWNKFPPKSLKLFSSKIFETNIFQIPTFLHSYNPTFLHSYNPEGDASNSEHLPVFRAPREGNGRMHQFMDAKKLHGKGTDTYTDGHCDSMKESANGRFFEKLIKSKCHKLKTKMITRFKNLNSDKIQKIKLSQNKINRFWKYRKLLSNGKNPKFNLYNFYFVLTNMWRYPDWLHCWNYMFIIEQTVVNN